MVRAWTVAYHAAVPTKLLVRAGGHTVALRATSPAQRFLVTERALACLDEK